jgi:DNA modification methylase
MKTKRVAIASLVRDPKNPRVHNERNLEAISASLERFGQVEPIVVEAGTNRILGGHGRVLALEAKGETHVVVVEADVHGDDARALSLALNRTGDLATYDNDLLIAALEGLEVPGFTAEDIAELVPDPDTSLVEDPGPQELPKIPTTKLGDLWLLGNHRLLCGDSTKPEDVARLMNGEKSGLINTDPPWGVSYDNADRPNPGVAKPRVANDELTDAELQSFLEAAFRAALPHLHRAAWYLWHAHLTQGYFAAAAAAANVVLHRQIIWVKPVLLLTRGHFHWKHEPCFMGWVRGEVPPDYGRGNGERDQTTVWEIDSVPIAERKEMNHSTPKPVELFRIPIIKHLKAGEIAFEPFAGSGPQFIAAEETGRRCYGIETIPRYCDAIVARWEKATGKKAVLER